MKITFGRTIAPALMLVAGVALAQQPATPEPTPAPGSGPGMMMGGPGMMGGYGPGARGGYGPGQGMGPGAMGGCPHGPGMGPGMMGGGYGPGMMGGGMMGGGMMGPGMMSGGMMMGRALWSLDLDENQRKEVLAIADELRKKHWDAAGKMQDEMVKMRDAAGIAGKRDRATILAAHKRMAELRQQRLESSLDAAERIEKVLTAEQRERLGRMGPWWMMGGAQ